MDDYENSEYQNYIKPSNTHIGMYPLLDARPSPSSSHHYKASTQLNRYNENQLVLPEITQPMYRG